MRIPVLHLTLALAAATGSPAAMAAVSADEAAKLKSELTPLGAERAGNKEGTIPAWTGGLTTPTPGFKNGGRRPDPFAGEKPVLQITAKNADQYADKLTEGTKALLKKYPDSFRLDVYPTHRTAAAPQSLYDGTLRNATRATLVDGPAGPMPKDALGGVPFPIPKSGTEVMWNAMLRWRGESPGFRRRARTSPRASPERSRRWTSLRSMEGSAKIATSPSSHSSPEPALDWGR